LRGITIRGGGLLVLSTQREETGVLFEAVRWTPGGALRRLHDDEKRRPGMELTKKGSSSRTAHATNCGSKKKE